MAGMTMKAAKSVYEQTLKAQILKAMQDAFTSTFGGENTDLGKAMALKFAQTASDGLAGPICETIVNIVSQAQITGVNPVVSTIIATPMTGGPCNGVLSFNGTELNLS